MNTRQKGPWYRVQYRLRGHTETQTRDLILPGRTEVMKHLQKSEGVTTDGCYFLYVNEHRSDGTVAVVVEYEDPSYRSRNTQEKPLEHYERMAQEFQNRHTGKTKKTDNLPVVIGGPTPPANQIITSVARAVANVSSGRVIATKHALGRYRFKEAS